MLVDPAVWIVLVLVATDWYCTAVALQHIPWLNGPFLWIIIQWTAEDLWIPNFSSDLRRISIAYR